ncbi:alpha amylase N-terminal ig-like domain-containing protein, partial [Vibrio sp.]|uniref:alpha amylase N-terminal ig-like domain-containing protein n=1 Tax=Vibrio sp. TaxID=678 RepID=UPI003D0CA727
MHAPFLFHGQTESWVTCHDNGLSLTLAIEASFPCSKVLVRHEPDNEEMLVVMEKTATTERLSYWQATIPLNQDRAITHYVFKVLTTHNQWWLDAKSVSTRIPSREYHFKYNTQHQPPRWVSQQIFYQIFPDRFANGKPEISVKSGEYSVSDGKSVIAKTWGEPVDSHQGNGGCEFYGGDLYGVEEKL